MRFSGGVQLLGPVVTYWQPTHGFQFFQHPAQKGGIFVNTGPLDKNKPERVSFCYVRETFDPCILREQEF